MAKANVLFLIFGLAILCFPVLMRAQDADEETIRVRTRVVYIDALVKDKKTGASVADLTRENFEVLADGKPRAISYFNRAGDVRKRPLALILVVDGGKELRRAGVLESMTAALMRLAPEDEVAVIAREGDTSDLMKTLADFTRDRSKMSEALAAVRNLSVPTKPVWYVEVLRSVLKTVERAAAARPDSQIIVVPVTADYGPLRFTERDEITSRLIRANGFFSPLIFDSVLLYAKMHHVPMKIPLPPRPIFDTIGRLVGIDHNAPQHIAQQTGGEATSVQKPEDYGAALERFIADLSTRYNLGFTLEDNEPDDGRMHKLEVRVKVRDSHGKKQNLIVRARRGYYRPKADGAAVVK